VIDDLASDLAVTDLSSAETFAALSEGGDKGVRGGRTHDYLHAVAAVNAGCERIRTLNTSDFEDLFGELVSDLP
jgi:hypothetical protein